MDLSRLASIHKSIRSWQEELQATEALNSEEKKVFEKKLVDLKEILNTVWMAGKISPEQQIQISSQARELDRLFDECRLLG
jgi:hypothetical protein